MYADSITESMQRTIDETARRRSIQMQYNEAHHIVPKPIEKKIGSSLTMQTGSTETAQQRGKVSATKYAQLNPTGEAFVADPISRNMSKEALKKSIANTTALMKQAAKELDFLQAAQYRDEIVKLESLLNEK